MVESLKSMSRRLHIRSEFIHRLLVEQALHGAHGRRSDVSVPEFKKAASSRQQAHSHRDRIR